MSELKPCPFCGGEAFVEDEGVGTEPERYWVWHERRNGCFVEGTGCYEIESEAIEAWNTRYQPTCHWDIKHSGPMYDVYQCDVCGYEYAESRCDHGIKVEIIDAKYCPNCGAKVVRG